MKFVRIALALCLLALFFGGLGWVIYDDVRRDSAADEITGAFLSALKAGDPAAAHRALSAERRAKMSVAELAALTDLPIFREHDSWFVGKKEPTARGLCALGELEGKADWKVQFFYVQNSGRFFIHSFAVQPPATVALGTLLPECGYSAGTTMGYRGPPIARTTAPTF